MTDLTKLVTILQHYHPELTAEELADVIWLARQMPNEETKTSMGLCPSGGNVAKHFCEKLLRFARMVIPVFSFPPKGRRA